MINRELECLDIYKGAKYPRPENWGKYGMPPQIITVLDRQIVGDYPSSTTYKVYILGYHPHLGKLHRGWQGQETIVDEIVRKAQMTYTLAE